MTTSTTRRHLIAGTAAAGLLGRRAWAQAPRTVKIGVLTDMSGPFKDLGGPNVVACIRQAVQDSGVTAAGLSVEVLVADHQNKPDIGSGIARQWFDRDGVDCIADINNSGVAIALTGLCREKNKVQLNTGAASSDIIGKYCTPNLIHWTFDSWQTAHAVCVPVVEQGGKSWFIITADYTFGHNTERDATAFIKSAGGTVAGSAAYPFPGTSDFSSFLLQAQASGAKVLGLATSGTDTINIVKQAAEFGLTAGGMRIAGLGMYINDVFAIGVQTAQNVMLSEMFYWDQNERTRAFAGRGPRGDERRGAEPGARGRLFRRVQLPQGRGQAGRCRCAVGQGGRGSAEAHGPGRRRARRRDGTGGRAGAAPGLSVPG